MRVVIVGAGIAGLSVARALLARGVRPTVIAPDHGATALGAGIVSAQFWDRALLPLARRSQAIIRSLVPVHRAGMAQIALSERTARLVERLDGTGLPRSLRFRPGFARRIVLARWSRDEFWVDSRRLIAAFSRGLTIERRRVRRVDADRVVWATAPGRRVRAVLARADVRVPTMFHVLDSGLYMRGALAGDGSIANVRRALAEALGARCSFLRAGTVAMSRRPIVRRRGRVWIVGGFGGDGLALAPAIGERVADEVIRG